MMRSKPTTSQLRERIVHPYINSSDEEEEEDGFRSITRRKPRIAAISPSSEAPSSCIIPSTTTKTKNIKTPFLRIFRTSNILQRDSIDPNRPRSFSFEPPALISWNLTKKNNDDNGSRNRSKSVGDKISPYPSPSLKTEPPGPPPNADLDLTRTMENDSSDKCSVM